MYGCRPVAYFCEMLFIVKKNWIRGILLTFKSEQIIFTKYVILVLMKS